jgi:hypothetical protein
MKSSSKIIQQSRNQNRPDGRPTSFCQFSFVKDVKPAHNNPDLVSILSPATMMNQTPRRIYDALRKSSPLLQSRHASSHQRPPPNEIWDAKSVALGALLCVSTGASLLATSTQSMPRCESITLTSLPSVKEEEDEEFDSSLPIYTSAQVAVRNGKDMDEVWMSYGGYGKV